MCLEMATNAVLHAIVLVKLNPWEEIDPRVDGNRISSFAPSQSMVKT